jgi:hypothetical protein
MPRMAGPRHSLSAVRMMIVYRADRRMWQLAVVAVLVAVVSGGLPGLR